MCDICLESCQIIWLFNFSAWEDNNLRATGQICIQNFDCSFFFFFPVSVSCMLGSCIVYWNYSCREGVEVIFMNYELSNYYVLFTLIWQGYIYLLPLRHKMWNSGMMPQCPFHRKVGISLIGLTRMILIDLHQLNPL